MKGPKLGFSFLETRIFRSQAYGSSIFLDRKPIDHPENRGVHEGLNGRGDFGARYQFFAHSTRMRSSVESSLWTKGGAGELKTSKSETRNRTFKAQS